MASLRPGPKTSTNVVNPEELNPARRHKICDVATTWQKERTFFGASQSTELLARRVNVIPWIKDHYGDTSREPKATLTHYCHSHLITIAPPIFTPSPSLLLPLPPLSPFPSLLFSSLPVPLLQSPPPSQKPCTVHAISLLGSCKEEKSITTQPDRIGGKRSRQNL